MTSEVRQLAEHYRAATTVFLDLVGGLAASDLDAARPDGEWTPRAVIHHMADAETRSAVRLRQLLAEERPVIIGYDENTYARRLRYDRPVEASVAVVGAVRAANAELLAGLDPDDLGRTGTHTESGPYSLRTWLEIYTAHPRDHAAQIAAALAASDLSSG